MVHRGTKWYHPCTSILQLGCCHFFLQFLKMSNPLYVLPSWHSHSSTFLLGFPQGFSGRVHSVPSSQVHVIGLPSSNSHEAILFLPPQGPFLPPPNPPPN